MRNALPRLGGTLVAGVLLALVSTAAPAGAASYVACRDISLAPNSGQLIYKIRAKVVSCRTARSLLTTDKGLVKAGYESTRLSRGVCTERWKSRKGARVIVWSYAAC